MRFTITFLLAFGLILSVRQAASAQPETVVFIVRHAEKSLESTDDPNLSEAGQARAGRLRDMLRDAGITAI